jgi:membrane-bound lytic murein transglycosylase A
MSAFTRFGRLLAAAGACAALAACTSQAPATVDSPLRVVPPGSWPDFVDDMDRQSLDAAMAHSLAYFEALPEGTVVTIGSEQRTAAELAAGVVRFQELVRNTPDPRHLRKALQSEFILLRSVGRDGHGEVLFTPRAIVGRVEGNELVPYADRCEIDFGEGLRSQVSVLGYLADPVDAFFLNVKGSGTLEFRDGSRLRDGYAVSNGREYKSIGKLLIDEGLVPREQMSMQAIRAYLTAHPEDLERVLTYNPSYVFFRELETVDGPIGCYGVPVTAGRSIATDRRLFPAPVMAWIEGSMPAPDGGQQEFSRFAVNQDTGGSIRGPGRVDLFIGAGDDAAGIAGRMQDLGRLYLFLPSSI